VEWEPIGDEAGQVAAGQQVDGVVRTLMAEISLPEHLQVGEGYGKVSWDVRAIWENYSGWFHHRSTTELYPVGADAVSADLVELAGADAITARARRHLTAGRTLHAIHLAETVTHAQDGHAEARAILHEAHQQLLAASVNFWERAWLTAQIERYS
jgi:alkyl sulfatase BDS1-like metallo-beta-lactamase superfamily hydrolase